MSQSILVTGGAGCIGSDLAEQLLARGHRVTVLDNLSSGRREHVQPFLAHPQFHWLEGDLLDERIVAEALTGVDMVYHLAANPDVKFVPGEPTDKDLRQNTLATHLLLDQMRRAGVKRLAFASTSAVYGNCDRFPIPEAQPLRPISLYGASKAACESLISAFGHLFDMQCWVFRFANIVGPKTRKQGGTVIGDFIQRLKDNPKRLLILGNGRQAKSYLLSTDCVAAMLHAVEHARASLNVFNLGPRDWIEVTRIAELVVDGLGFSDVRFEYTGTEGGWAGDVPRFLLDVSAMQQLGWETRHTSEQAVRRAIGAALAPAGVLDRSPSIHDR